MYAYYAGAITKDKLLEIRDENNEVVKEGMITKDINYIFYSSQKLNEKNAFHIFEQENGAETKLDTVFNTPENGEDNEDINY